MAMENKDVMVAYYNALPSAGQRMARTIADKLSNVGIFKTFGSVAHVITTEMEVMREEEPSNTAGQLHRQLNHLGVRSEAVVNLEQRVYERIRYEDAF